MALRRAVENGDLRVIKDLVQEGADVNLKDPVGDTPMHLAAIRGYTAVVAYLVENKADIESKGYFDSNLNSSVDSFLTSRALWEIPRCIMLQGKVVRKW